MSLWCELLGVVDFQKISEHGDEHGGIVESDDEGEERGQQDDDEDEACDAEDDEDAVSNC